MHFLTSIVRRLTENKEFLVTKVEAGAVVRLEEFPTGSGMNVGSFTDQQLHIGKASPLYGHMESGLPCQSHTAGHTTASAMLS